MEFNICDQRKNELEESKENISGVTNIGDEGAKLKTNRLEWFLESQLWASGAYLPISNMGMLTC